MSMRPDEEAVDPSTRPGRPHHSPWSIGIGTYAGIPVRLHFTFLLFLAWIYIVAQQQGMLTIVFLLLGLFLCVILHEYGHALTARRYGIQTRDITLYPIGGVAMITGRPKPREELWIALAGPAVNVVIALLLIPISFLVQGRAPEFAFDIQSATFIDGLFALNVFLPAFNMVPAFPMDGGRVLRALLALRMSEYRATQIAGRIGQFLAVLVGFYALLDGQVGLMLIAFFVYLGAGQEVSALAGLALVEGRRVRDAMITRFAMLEGGMPMDAAARLLLEGSQQDFPVVHGEETLGILTRIDIARGLATEGPSAYVAGFMRREFKQLLPDEPLERAMEMFAEGDNSPALVMGPEGRLLGMVTGENLSEFIMLEHARTHRARH